MNIVSTQDSGDIVIKAKEQLIEKVKHFNPQANIKKIEKAFNFAHKAHIAQFRASGEPYIIHPIAVAEILAELKMDTSSIITALLHDTVEDTSIRIGDIEKLFGKQVANLVDGVTKLAKIRYQPERVKQAENFRKLLVAISSDIRVLLVKLADRLHNMRTLKYIKSDEKRFRIAHETMEIYAPLAERMGIHRFKNELQDLAFMEIHPDIQISIKSRLEFLRSGGKSLVDIISTEVRKILAKANVKAVVQGREKTPCSIWKKMENKKIAFEQLVDIVAFRILVDTVPECYQVLGVIHSHYHMLPNGFSDYISTPKQNSYKSLHTIVMGPENRCIEIQIRTHVMHEIAEIGVAAHWVYKQGGRGMEGKQYKWIRELLEILENTSCPEEFLENTKLEMVYDQVFCFTPRGDLMAVPAGATPVDFAFAVDSGVGLRCIGAKINSHIAPLHTILKNGDQVEIITSENPSPSPTWEDFIVTGKARAEIRKFIRLKKHNEYVNLGKAMLINNLQKLGKNFELIKLKKIIKFFDKASVDDLLAAIGDGSIERAGVLQEMYPDEYIINKNKRRNPLAIFSKKDKEDAEDAAVPISGLIPGMAIQFANCCHPLPGDRIVGIVNTGQGVAIHTMDCDILKNFSGASERWINVSWEDTESEKYIGRIKVVVLNEFGVFARVVARIADERINISNVKIITRKEDFFELILDLEVENVEQLNGVINAISVSGGIHSVQRYKMEETV